ncbi:MAG: hypothetical protein ACOY3I_06320 [Verrucomicrobiota bacterium]
MKIIIGVGIAGHPISAAGNTWAFLQWALGFRSLGWEVWLVEQVDSRQCIDVNFQPVDFDRSANFSHWKKITEEFGFSCSLFVDGKTENEKDFFQFARDAKVFLNISGHFKQHRVVAHIPHRIYLDLDPAFTQIWASAYHCDMNFEGHNHFFSVGTRIASARIPVTGHTWIPTPPPVDLTFWTPQERATSPSLNHWTTVTHWYGYNDIEWDGMPYTGKAAEFKKISKLPSMTSASLMLAADLKPENEEYAEIVSQGWKIYPASEICGDWKTYRQFLADSRGEFAMAKGGYVTSRCGWFSDRSACYLALGKPVILQETGWSEFFKTEKGLLSFTDLSSAVDALKKIESDYESHSRAARKIAEKFLDARKVAHNLLNNIGL